MAISYSPSGHRVTYWNAFNGAPPFLGLGGYDVLLLHTTVLCLRWFDDYAKRRQRLNWLSRLDCLKIAMPQDEYDHSEVLDEWLYSLGVDHVFSNFGSEERPLIYPRMINRATFHHAFTGYIDDNTARRLQGQLQEASARPYDVVYRGSKLPYWFGSHGQLKHRIGEQALKAAKQRGLSADISTRNEDAITGESWFGFLASGRTAVGCESGSSVLDRRGEIKSAITNYLREHPAAGFEEVAAQLPGGWDSYHFVAISPRHFEAVITRTCQVLVAGRYDGVLQAGRHYVPVSADLTDLVDALEMASDPAVAAEVAERTYEEIYRSGRYSYGTLAAELDRVMETRPPRRAGLSDLVWAVATRIGDSQLRNSPDPDAGLDVPLDHGHDATPLGKPLSQMFRLSMQPDGFGALRRAFAGPAGKRLLSSYMRAGGAARDIPAELLVRESILLNRMMKAQSMPPGSSALRAVKATSDGSTLEVSVLRGSADVHAPMAELVWPPATITVHGLHVGSGQRTAARLQAVSALAQIRERDVRLAISSLLDAIGGARSRPRLLDRKARLLRVVVLARTLIGQPSNLKLVATATGRAPLGEIADDLLKVSELRRLMAGGTKFASSIDPATGTLHLVTEIDSHRQSDVRIGRNGEVQRIVWDNSAVSDHVLVPVAMGRRLTLFLGTEGIHEFTAIAALRAADRNALLRRLGKMTL